MKSYVFAYGTLCNDTIRRAVLGRSCEIIPAQIKGFQMKKITISGIVYPILIEDSTSTKTIKGGYFQVDQKELQKLDEYESNAYRRKIIQIEPDILAWVYYQ